MIIRLIVAAGVAASFLLSPPAFAATSKQKMETCTFGADDQKLTGAKRKTFMSKCMSNANSPRGKPAMLRPNPQ
jgi:psiF repeat